MCFGKIQHVTPFHKIHLSSTKLFHKNSRRIFVTATSGRYTELVTVSSVADVEDKQSPWEQSGIFEGEIMLNEEERNGLINPGGRWPNEVVPFDTDDVYSEYCSVKLQSGTRGLEGNIHAL
jgi:hypothetical protein